MTYETAINAARSAINALSKTEHGNIHVAGAIEKLFENFDRIPIDDLEKFVSAYNADKNLTTKQFFLREEVETVIQDILDQPDTIIDAISNENTNWDSESLLNHFEKK